MRTQDQLIQLFARVIVANELSDNQAYAYVLSDPDGARSGKSGWSFGRSQFDTQNNKQALQCLAECGFDAETIQQIVDQTIDVRPLNSRLKEHAEIIDRYDIAQFRSCIQQTQALASKHDIVFADDSALIAVADYANQYGMSDKMEPGYMIYFMACLHRPVSFDDIFKFKRFQTKYGRERPNDVQRRADNITRLCTA